MLPLIWQVLQFFFFFYAYMLHRYALKQKWIYNTYFFSNGEWTQRINESRSENECRKISALVGRCSALENPRALSRTCLSGVSEWEIISRFRRPARISARALQTAALWIRISPILSAAPFSPLPPGEANIARLLQRRKVRPTVRSRLKAQLKRQECCLREFRNASRHWRANYG